MTSRTRTPRPALAPCLALLVGAACGAPFTDLTHELTVLTALLGVATWAAPAGGRPRRVLLLLLCLGLGLCRDAGDRHSGALRRCAWLPAPGQAVELQLVGLVESAPLRGAQGERRLRLRGRPERGVTAPVAPIEVALLVRPSPEDASRALDRLRTGDRVRVWCRLRVPRGLANPGSSDPLDGMRARGLDAFGSVKSARLVEFLEPGSSPVLRGLEALSRLAGSRLEHQFGERPEVHAIVAAMLLGDRSSLEPPLLRRLRDAGLVHLIAISGMHVGLAVIPLLELLRRSRLAGALRWPILVLLLVGFATGVGARPSVVRAVLACVVAFGGRLLGRAGDPLNTLALLAALLVAHRPGLVADPGFQLSFLATAGILLAAPSLTGRTSALGGGLKISATAYAATAPVAARHFGRLAPVALISNLLALPLCAAILVSGYGSLLLADVAGAGPACRLVCSLAVRSLLALADAAGTLPLASLRVPAPGPGLVVAYFALLLLLLARPRRRRRGAEERVLRVLWLLSVALTHLGPPPRPAGKVEAYLVDVGQGQSTLLRGPGGGWLVVDAGGSTNPHFDPGEREVLPLLARLGARRLEAVFVSHDHLDHAGGVAALLRELEVGELWLGPGWHRSRRLRRLADLARRRGAAIGLAERGVRLSRAGLAVNVLGPSRGAAEIGPNDGSVVLLAGEAPWRILVPGDLQSAGEQALIATAESLRSEALVLAHHGSRSASGEALLARVAPEVALVSCGYRNRFSHPHESVVQRLTTRGIP